MKGNQELKLLEASLWLMEIKFLKKSVYDWHSLFKNGQEYLENWYSSRLGPSQNNENVTRIYAVMMSDKCVQWNR
jgi:hypothetical protein